LKDDPSGRPVGIAPPDNGTKFWVVEFLPLDAATEAKMPPEMLQKGITNAPARGIPVKHPLMHRTRSLDYAIILSGEIDMMLDDGDVHLKPGDVIVQQATNHAWINRGKEPCRILFARRSRDGMIARPWVCVRPPEPVTLLFLANRNFGLEIDNARLSGGGGGPLGRAVAQRTAGSAA
jgi:mannose-6-phosphate isomerase-like protein (cupin superfamily)